MSNITLGLAKVIEEVFGDEVDHRMMIRTPEPSELAGNTAYVERHNLTMRMSMRRYTRKTNGFSKKLARHRNMLALYFVHYNFVRVHQTLETAPAVKAGLVDKPYDLEWLAQMIEAACPKPNRPKRYKVYPKEPLQKLRRMSKM